MEATPLETLEEWYVRVMNGGQSIPPGVSIDVDGRAEQSCGVCGELVDHKAPGFTAVACSIHASQRGES